MKAFYGSRFSPNMTKTPEGFLICHNVPIGRTGWYEYLGQELNLNEFYDQIVKVYRSPEEVFSAAALASFEGKSVTDDHPSEDVRPDNYKSYEKGQVQNVRKGSGNESDCIVADLFIKDPILLSEIETGKREVSCGYDCFYEEIEQGKYKQTQICGNHVAIVNMGRAGNRISIKDESPKTTKSTGRRNVSMKKNIFGKMLAAFARDAAPEELVEAMDAMNGLTEEKPTATLPTAATKDEGGNPGLAAVIKAVNELTAKVDALVASDKQVHQELPKDALDELEGELVKGEEPAKDEGLEEESVTIPAEEIEEEKPQVADNGKLLETVKAMKPVIAAIKDPAERKKVSDALASSIRGQMAKTDDSKGYAGIMMNAQNAVKSKANDAAQAKDNSDFGMKCAQRNPHLKDRGGK